MTRITYQKQGNRHILTMRGHADYNPGNDPVCFGISAITYALWGALENAGDHGHIDECHKSSGEYMVTAEGDETVAAAFKMALIGWLQIEQQYPENISVDGADTAIEE